MTPLRRLLCALAMSLSAASVTPGASGAGETLRQGLTPGAQQDWLAVGRLNVTGQGFCTATLVAPDLVLTAAHCLVDRRTGRVVSPDRVNFLAGYRTGRFVAHGQGAALALLDGFSRAELTVSRDLGLVRLSAPLPEVRPIPLAGRVEAGARLEVLSYGIDRSQLPSLQGDCDVLRRRGTVLYTSCEGVPGVSGAPLLVATGEGARVAGVASSVSTRRKQPLPRGNLIAIAADPELTGALLDALGLTVAAIPAP